MSSQDNTPDPHAPEKSKLPFPIGSRHTTPYGGVVLLEMGSMDIGSDYDLHLYNTEGDSIAMMNSPLDKENKPFAIYVTSTLSRNSPSVFGNYYTDESGPGFEDKTAETFQEMVRVGALMLGYDPQKHTWEIECEDGSDPSPLTDVVLFTYAAETMLGKSRQFIRSSKTAQPTQE